MTWELRDFGPCIATWVSSSPPVEWRKAVNAWVRALQADPVSNAEREPVFDAPGWSGWFCEVPAAGNALVAVVAYYRVSTTEQVARCLAIETLPRFHE